MLARPVENLIGARATPAYPATMSFESLHTALLTADAATPLLPRDGGVRALLFSESGKVAYVDVQANADLRDAQIHELENPEGECHYLSDDYYNYQRVCLRSSAFVQLLQDRGAPAACNKDDGFSRLSGLLASCKACIPEVQDYFLDTYFFSEHDCMPINEALAPTQGPVLVLLGKYESLPSGHHDFVKYLPITAVADAHMNCVVRAVKAGIRSLLY
jgi:hypothetical protein